MMILDEQSRKELIMKERLRHDKIKKIENLVEKIGLPFGIIMFIALCVAFVCLIINGFDSTGCFTGCIVSLLSGAIFFGLVKVQDSFEAKAQLILNKIENIEKESFEDKIAKGEWDFPAEELYIECEEEGVDSYSTDYEKKKIYLIAQSLLKNKIPDKHFDIYLNEASLEKYFNQGKKAIDEQRIKKLEESFLPKQGNLSEKERETVKLAQKVKPLYGCEKRKTVLIDAIEKTKKSIIAYKEGQDALKTLGIALSNSVQQEKKKDWAILGGIASGIGGTGASVSVATQAMLENNEIDRRNAQLKRLANQTISEMYSSSTRINSDIYDLQKELELFKYHLKEIDKKVVWKEYDSKEIFKKLYIYSTVKKTKDLCGLQINVEITNNFGSEDLSGITTVVDGTLQADIYHNDNTFVDSVCIPLPLFGVSTEEKVLMYTDMYVEANGEYTVKVKPNKLWVMEE